MLAEMGVGLPVSVILRRSERRAGKGERTNCDLDQLLTDVFCVYSDGLSIFDVQLFLRRRF